MRYTNSSKNQIHVTCKSLIARLNPTKWSNTLQQFVGNNRLKVRLVFSFFFDVRVHWLNKSDYSSLTNCLSVFDHFVEFAFKGLNKFYLQQVCNNETSSIYFNYYFSHSDWGYLHSKLQTNFPITKFFLL